MIRASVLALALSASAIAATAAAQDSRMVERLYDETEVVRIEGKVNVQSTIRFADGERIENVAIGDSAAWQVTPNRRANLLFVKPLSLRASTNMTVVTDKRTYLFDLVANPAARQPLYMLTFTYPEPIEEEQPALAGAGPGRAVGPQPNALEVAAASDDYAVLDPSTLNFDWANRGAENLWPEQVYDNGEVTFLAWAEGAAMPAILLRDRDGNEGPVNFAVRDNLIVLDLVPQQIILRSGDDEALLVNNGDAGATLADGTSRAASRN